MRLRLSRNCGRHCKRRCLHLPPPTETTIIGLNVANILAVSITVSVQLINNDGDNVHIVKDAIVPVGSSLVAVGGDQKIVMNASDILRVTASQTDCRRCSCVGTGDLVMALSTVDTNQIANGKVKNEDMVASTSTNPFRSNATSIDTT